MKKISLVVLMVSVQLIGVNAQSFPAYAPVNGLVAWYPLDAKAQARDISNNGNNARLNGAEPKIIDHTEDRFGVSQGAMNVPEKELLTIGAAPDYTLYPYFSLGAWFNSTARGYSNQTIVSKSLPDGQPVVALTYEDSQFRYHFKMMGDSTTEVISRGNPMNANGWHFAVCTFDGKTMKLYVDGLPAGELSLYYTTVDRFRKFMVNSKSPVIAGNTTGKNGSRFIGALDDLFIYNRSLTADEILKLYESGSTAATRFRKSGFTLEDPFYKLETEHNSYLPWFNSVIKLRTANTINKTIQLAEFHKIKTPKISQLEDNRMNPWWTDVTMPTNRLLIVSLSHHVTDYSRRDRPSLDFYTSYYFDAMSGDRIYLTDFFSKEGFQQVSSIINSFLFEKEAEEECRKVLPDYWLRNGIRLTVNPYTLDFKFAIDECRAKEFGEEYEEYQLTIPWSKISPALSPVGKFYFDNGPIVAITNVTHTWSALINQKIPLTLALRTSPDGKVTGEEVYDNHGESIKVEGTFTNGVMTLHELDGNGKSFATIEATLQGRKLEGKWTNADGTKTFTFSAGVGGE